jgi:DNA-binding response OmpR family regulator
VITALVISDSGSVRREIVSALEPLNLRIIEVDAGDKVREIATREEPDLVIADMQVGNMGGVAICMDLRLEESGGRIPRTEILLVMDRRADVFLARRCGADGFLVKPLNPLRIRQAARTLLDGERFEDDSNRPETIELVDSAGGRDR